MRLTIYTKPGCHLCDDMKSLIHRVVKQHAGQDAISIDEIDISTDRDLLDRYGLEIPVLMIDGQKVAKYRVTEAALIQMLQRRGAKGEG